MNTNSENLITVPVARHTHVEIPVSSPYYDRLRSLNMQMDFVPYGSPEYHYLDHEIAETERRAIDRMAAARMANTQTYI